MEEWKTIHISDIGKIVTGKTPRTSIAENYGGRIPFLTPSDDLSGKYAPHSAKTLTNLGLAEVKNCLLPDHAICVSCIGSDLGKVVMTKQPTVTNQQFNSIIPNADFDPDFVYYLMTIVGKKLNYLSKTSTAVPIVNKSSFSAFEVSVPPLHEQKRIARILSSIDDIIALNNRINHNLEEQAQALYKSWFVDFEPFKDRVFIDSELGMIPKGWRVGHIEELISDTYNGDWGKDEETGAFVKKVFCIRGADIPSIRVGDSGKMPTRFIQEKHFLSKYLKDNDIVVEISGGSPTQSTGRFCRVTEELVRRYDNSLVCTNFCKALRPKDGCSIYVSYLWNDLYERGIMFSYENGTTGIKNLNLNGLLSGELIVIPDKNTMGAFSDIVRSLNQQALFNGHESEKLSCQRDALIPKLMSGELSEFLLTC